MIYHMELFDAIFFILLLFLSLILSNSNKYDNNNIVVYLISEKQYIFIQDNYYFTIADEFTAKLLGYDSEQPKYVSNVNFLSQNYMKSNVEIMKYQSSNKSDLLISYKDVLTYINKLHLLVYKKNFITNSFYIKQEISPFKLTNAAVVPIDKDRYLISIHRHGYYWMNETLIISETLNNELLPILIKDPDTDNRILKLPNGNLLSVFTVIISGRDDCKIGIRYLYKSNKYQYNFSDQIILFTESNYKSLSNSLQKNWSPFYYYDNNDNINIYFIEKLNPFHVIEINNHITKNPTTLTYHNKSYSGQLMSTVSMVHCNSFQWRFGEIRGGTPALLIRGQYLGFMHSNCHTSKLRDLITGRSYFIGAYTFTSTLPFTMTSISRFPIQSNFFEPYQLWNRDFIDLVVFPMSFFIRNNDSTLILNDDDEKDQLTTTIVMTVGYNNVDTAVVEMNLNDVLNSLMPIKC